MRRYKFLLITLIVLPIILVMGTYIGYFVFLKGYSLSDNAAHWGTFGDYFGGTLNPIYALLAFLGVLLTIFLQSEQLEFTKKQTILEELQRLIFNSSKEIDNLLQQRPKTEPEEFAGKEHPFVIWSLILALGSAFLNSDPNAQIYKDKTLPCIDFDLTWIVRELEQLIWSLEQYQLLGGSDLLIEFYRKRYERITCLLNAADLLNSRSAKEFFKPEEFEKFLKPENLN